MPRSSRMIAFARRAMRCSTRPGRAMAIRCRLSSSLRKLDRIMGVMNRGQPALAIPFRLLTVSGYSDMPAAGLEAFGDQQLAQRAAAREGNLETQFIHPAHQREVGSRWGSWPVIDAAPADVQH